MRSQQAVGNANPHHEVGKRLALAAFSAEHAGAVTLRVDAPGAEVCAHPLGRNGLNAAAREAADFVEMLPRILLALQALDALRLVLGFGLCWRHKSTLK